MHVEIKPTQNSYFGHVVHFTKGGFDGNYGDRMPYVFFHALKLIICSAVNGQSSHCYDTGVVNPLNKWISLKLNQIRLNNDYVYNITVDGMTLYSVINTQPEEFINVKAYLGDIRANTDNSQTGFVRNLWLMVQN